MNLRPIALAALLCGIVASPCVVATDSPGSGEAEIGKLLDDLVDAYEAKDIPLIMSAYVPDESLVVFDVAPPYKYVGAKAYTGFYEKFYADYPGPVTVTAKERSITVRGSTAYAHEIDTWVVTSKGGVSESVTALETYVFARIDGKWFIVHEHASIPVDMSAANPE